MQPVCINAESKIVPKNALFTPIYNNNFYKAPFTTQHIQNKRRIKQTKSQKLNA